ncbi:MAG: hypothetical protein JWR10_1616, partial [Rubritepida sp.]|nr:hypothetical protein [Rubritepida sp.]
MIRLWPEAASEVAVDVDRSIMALIGISGAIMLLVFGLLLGFAIRYRRG